MKFKKSFQLALNMLFHSKVRSWLTIIGIVIGIAAVVSIISISLGAQQQLQSRLGGLGADILTVSPGAQRASGFGFGGDRSMSGESTSSQVKNLTERDIVAIKSVSNVKYVLGQISGQADVTYSSKTSKNSRVTGVDISVWKDVTTETLSSGRFLTKGDAYSVVIGNRLATSVFGKEIPINSKIIIGGVSFNVVGITSEGSSIYMPIAIARTILEDKNNGNFDSISVKITDVSLSNQTVTGITKKLMLLHGILQESKKDFSVSNPAEMQQTIQQTLNTMTLFLGAIAAISLLVGAIGIANTMFTSTLEKTREIGVLKAVGAKNRDILAIFLINSGLIGFVGGFGGVVLGTIASALISGMAGIGTSTTGGGIGRGGGLNLLTSSSVVNVPLILGALLFAVLIGMIAGAIPAYRASKLNPVDALRYE
jgi:putative ABC transport system permease protein